MTCPRKWARRNEDLAPRGGVKAPPRVLPDLVELRRKAAAVE